VLSIGAYEVETSSLKGIGKVCKGSRPIKLVWMKLSGVKLTEES